MHEALFDDAWLEGTGVTTLDFAKAMIDAGFHPMTMYFPLVVHGAMLIEPTETEPRHEVDRFCDTLLELAAELAPYAPLPWVVHGADGLQLVEHRTASAENAIGRLKGFHGQMGMFVRALAYMMSHGADGLRQAAEDAVLNANYLRVQLEGELSLSFPGPCMHEVLFDDGFLKDTGVTTLDFAKALIDEGYHPMTMYFPLIVHGAMLIEPTETESKASLDEFAAVVKALAAAVRSGDGARLRAAPRMTPRRRLDETAAARKPDLRWRREA